MQLSALLDLDVVALEQPDELTLLVELAAPAPSTSSTRPPTTLQVVLDRSGSMGGERLSGAKTALLLLVDQLQPTDNFGLVAFDNAVQVVVPAGPLRDKDVVKRAIAAVEAGGSTDLSAGYLRGLQEAQRVCGAAGATVVLVSDGHANAGITDPAQLGPVAAHAHRNGVTTTTLGFGLGYDERLLAALARSGQGNEHFAEEADTAVKLLAGEVEGLLEKVAEAVSMTVRMGPQVEALAVVNDVAVADVPDGVMIELGSFYAGESRKLLLRFRVPAIAALGLAEIATLALTHVSLPDLVQHTTDLPVHVNVVPGDQAAGRIPDPVVRSEALFQDVQKQKRQASEQLSQGDVGGAMALLASSADALRAGVAFAPPSYADELLDELGTVSGLAREVGAGFSERAAKASSYDAARKSRTRGRAVPHDVLVLERPDGERFTLPRWRLAELQRAARAAGLDLLRRGTNVEEVAAALCAAVPSDEPLHTFLARAAHSGGFRFRSAA